MQDIGNANNPSSTQSIKPQSAPTNPILIVFLIIFIAIISSLLTYILARPQPVTQTVQTEKPISFVSKQPEQKPSQPRENAWIKPKSSEKGYPLMQQPKGETSKKLYVYSLASKKKRLVDTSVYCCGGASGFGNSDPLSSNDLLYTAVIDKETGNLFLLSNETLEKKQITQNGGVSYITGWSPDSKKIIYNVGADTITSQLQGPIQYPPTKAKFKPIFDSGFFMFDIDSGKTTKLYPVEYIEGVIDDDNLLVRTEESGYKDYLIVFNTKTFEANFDNVKEQFGFGANQFNFTKDGKKWVFTLSRNPTADANIIYADFPKKEGTQIDTGSWAQVQWPLISPNGSKVAYTRQEEVWVYKTLEKTKNKLAKGWPKMWIDEKFLITFVVNYDKNESDYYILDTESGQVEKMD